MRAIVREVLLSWRIENMGTSLTDVLATVAGNLFGLRRSRPRLQRNGPNAYTVRVDVSDQASIDAAIATVVERTGSLDVLIINSSGTSRANYDRLFSINVGGTRLTMQAAAQQMIAHGRGEKIMASQAGRRGEPLVTINCATKATVISLTQSARLALIKHGINVNAISLGVVDREHRESVDALLPKYQKRPLGENEAHRRRGHSLTAAWGLLRISSGW